MSTKIITSENVPNKNENGSEDIFEYNFCLRCHRRLKNPEYRLRGMGKVCWEKTHQEQSMRLF